MDRAVSKDLSNKVTDERINTVTAQIGALLAVLGAGLLIAKALNDRSGWELLGYTIYGLSLIFMFTMSTLHHSLPDTVPRANKVFRRLDYISIFFLIAGTTTPLVMILDRSVTGWIILGIVWAVALTGAALCAFVPKLPGHISGTFFIVLGWMPVVLLLVTSINLSLPAVALLALGGVLYSVGLIMFASERPNPVPGIFGFHEIWHIMVIVAALCHFLFMYWFVP